MDLILDVNIQIYPVDLGKTWGCCRLGWVRRERMEPGTAGIKEGAASGFLGPLCCPQVTGGSGCSVRRLSWVLAQLPLCIWGHLCPFPHRLCLGKLFQL